MKKKVTYFSRFAFFPVLAIAFLQTTAQVNVLTQHNDLQRTGWMTNERILTPQNVSSGNFGKLFTRQVDDQIYTQPLLVSGLPIKGKRRNVVYVATVNNSVYAFDAETDTANTPLWFVNLTVAGSRAIKNNDMSGACGGFYKDFSGNMGIVGTPVIDSVSSTMYVVARSVTTGTPKKYVQYLHALDVRTGAERPGSPIFITDTVNGHGDGSVNGKIAFDQQKQNQRPGLLLYNGIVYIGWASHCDWSPYHGWLLGYDATTLQLKYSYNSTPEGGLAGIWMSGQAPAVDDQGFIYVSTGNGTVGVGTNPNDTTNRGESLLKLSTQSGNLKVVDFFTPSNYKDLEAADLDYGVDGVLLIPGTNLSLSGSKQSRLYLINNNAMGGVTANNSTAKEVININAIDSKDHHLHGSPVYYKNSTKEYIYAWAEGSLLRQIPFNRTSLLLDTAHQITGTYVLPKGMPGGMLSLSSNGLKKNTGILWVSHPLSGDANQKVVPGMLQAFAADDVTHELWNSNMNAPRDSSGKFAKFVCPTIANGKVYMPSFSNKLMVYGLNPPAAKQSAQKDYAVNNNAGTKSFQVFPNPARQQFMIKYKDDFATGSKVSIELTTTYGQLVYRQNNLYTANNTISVSLPAGIASGVYVLQLISEKGDTRTKQIVIEK